MDHQELASRLEILNLEGAYGALWDSGRAQDWADLFAEDGVFTLAAAGGIAGRSFHGTVALRGFCEDVTLLYRGLHILGTPWLRIEGEQASGRVHFQWIGFASTGQDCLMQRQTFGYYDIDYVRTDQGWRITHRREKPTSATIGHTFGM